MLREGREESERTVSCPRNSACDIFALPSPCVDLTATGSVSAREVRAKENGRAANVRRSAIKSFPALTLSTPSFSTASFILSWMILSLSLWTVLNPSRTCLKRSFGTQSAILRIGSLRMKNPIVRWSMMRYGVGLRAPARGENMEEKAAPRALLCCLTALKRYPKPAGANKRQRRVAQTHVGVNSPSPMMSSVSLLSHTITLSSASPAGFVLS